MAGKVVVVTGAGRGIGQAVCLRFAKEGAKIMAASRTASELEETRILVEKVGGQCTPIPTDVCQADEIAALIETTVRQHQRTDVLVNCAGVARQCDIEQLDPQLFEMIQSVNMTATYHACRAVWPVMKAGGGGAIVNISSVASVDPFPGFTAYGASKAWINAWTHGLANEGRDHNIRVISVAPGAVETRLLRDLFPDFPKDQVLQPREIADVVYAMTLPDCETTSGETVFVNKEIHQEALSEKPNPCATKD